MTSYVVEKSRCPKCEKEGNDRNGDNLAIYSDGHCWCFRCGFYRPGDSVTAFKAKVRDTTTRVERPITLPGDVDFALPQQAWDFIGRYELTKQEAQRHNLMWSEYRQRLIFPLFDKTGLLGFQGRYLGTDTSEPKWFTRGDFKEILHIIENKQRPNTVVLTEDIISAIKVSRVVSAMPVFGSFVSLKTMLRLSRFYDTIVVWLDKDKEKESYCFSKQIRDLGLSSKSIITDKDPKELTNEEILVCLT